MVETAQTSSLAIFDYAEMTKRNIGFVSEAQQVQIQKAHIFVVGVGGMGGACVQALIRAGVQRFTIGEIDTFEVSNLNRQVFSNLDTVGLSKAQATIDQLKRINPDVEVKLYGAEWVDHLDAILEECKIVINGMDDIRAGVHLYRRAQAKGATVIDAYSSPLPSVSVVKPNDPRPETRYKSDLEQTPWKDLTPAQVDLCKVNEAIYVLTHSSSADHVDMDVAGEMMNGKRSRMSFAPMVITTGNLMAYEAMNLILGQASGTDYRGYFFNPMRARIEKPRPWFIAIPRSWVVKAFLKRMMNGL